MRPAREFGAEMCPHSACYLPQHTVHQHAVHSLFIKRRLSESIELFTVIEFGVLLSIRLANQLYQTATLISL